MNPVLPTHPQPPLPDAQRTDRPSTRSLLRWGALVLALHLVVLLSLAGTLDWQLSSPQTLRTGPMQTRTIPAPAGATVATDPSQTPAARTRVALVEKAKPAPKPAPTAKPGAQKIATDPNTMPADKTSPPADPPVPELAVDKELNKALAAIDDMKDDDGEPLTPQDRGIETVLSMLKPFINETELHVINGLHLFELEQIAELIQNGSTITVGELVASTDS
jgi:hypothetical protein